jgi:uncharacterized protein YukE
MAELRDADPITFDAGAAQRLEAQLRATAGVLRSQIAHRNSLANAARKDWRGSYEVKFGARMTVCAADAERLAQAMDKAAGQVHELARLAKEEQDRRTKARAWKVEHDKWEREQENKSLLDQGHDLLFGDGEPEPPPLTPTDPPTLPVAAPDLANRE